jgi:hypothetical protein
MIVRTYADFQTMIKSQVLCLVELTARIRFVIQQSEKLGNKFAAGCQILFG